jgi:hypothetical protein
MKHRIPEKARLLEKLREGNFNVPDFVYVPAQAFKEENFDELKAFLDRHNKSYKVIARSAHPKEQFYKGGTFDSMGTYADVGGIAYARDMMIKKAKTTKTLSILRQQRFNSAPRIDPESMGVIVMPFIEGRNVMAKMIGEHWEFGCCRDRAQKVQNDPYITNIPYDRRLVQLSKDIQNFLGYRCEIEYVISADNEIFVVQAKDISSIEILEQLESERSIQLEGVRRIRKRRNYRERPIYVMDNKAFYIDVICKCEDLVLGSDGSPTTIEDILDLVHAYEMELEAFALKHERFAVLGLSIYYPDELYQIANHYLDDIPELQRKLSMALLENRYKIDFFLAEADTLIAKDRVRINLGTHDAYGIDTVRNPMWSVYWPIDHHEKVVKEFVRLGFKTGDHVGIEIGMNGKPIVFRL